MFVAFFNSFIHNYRQHFRRFQSHLLLLLLKPVYIPHNLALEISCQKSESKHNDGGSRVGYTLDDALGAIGFGRFQYVVLTYSGLGWVAEAKEMMLLSFMGPAIQSEWGLSANQESIISTMAFAGMLVGVYS
ncbi:putative MFS transporter superfamily [Helianthus anomalus]